MPIAISLMIFGAHIKRGFLFWLKDHISTLLPIMLTVEPRMYTIWACSINSTKHISLVFLVSVLRSTLNHMSLKYRCPLQTSNRVRPAYLPYLHRLYLIIFAMCRREHPHRHQSGGGEALQWRQNVELDPVVVEHGIHSSKMMLKMMRIMMMLEALRRQQHQLLRYGTQP